jgi:glycerol-3-phosphate acyltransferase PlsX
MSTGAADSPKATVRIAVDTMGGDYAPHEIVSGALKATHLNPIELVLVGDRGVLERELEQYGTGELSIKIVPSDGKIIEDEHPVQAIRHKPRASVVVATHLLKDGQVDALVSMGSTGATMASASLILGTLEGLERPCIGGPFLGLAPNTVVVDMGSSIDCRPSLLLDFAAMGCVFAHRFLKIEHPRVGLLSVGAEEAKGNRQVREGYQIFSESDLNFVGNVEGMDFFTGKADVIVCDGFVGNILMKFTEGLGTTMAAYLRKVLEGTLPATALEPLVSKIWEVNNLPKKMGGPLFGVNGVVIVGHGASKAEGVAGAIDTARKCVEFDLVEGMRTELAALRSG